MNAPTYLRVDDVIARTGLSRSTLYRLRKKGRFPKSVRLSDVAIGWRESDVAAWLKNPEQWKDAA